MLAAVTSLVDRFIPTFTEGWDNFLASPWLLVGLIVLALSSIRRHAVLSFGTYQPSLLVLLYFLVYLLSLMATGVSEVNLALLAMLILLGLSDLIVTSITRVRSPFFTYNIGFLLGLLFLIHPAFILLFPFYLAKLRAIQSFTPKHISAVIMGTLSIMLIAIMLKVLPTLEGLQSYMLSLVRPLTDLSTFKLRNLPIIILDFLYLSIITFAVSRVYRSSIVRVRFSLRYHLQLAWIIMIPHIVYNLFSELGPLFLLGSLFSSSVIADYMISQRATRWLGVSLLVIVVLVFFSRTVAAFPTLLNL